MDREIDRVVARLELRAVQLALAAVGGRAATTRARPRLVTRALVDEQHRDACVRRGVQRLLPAGSRPAAAPVLGLPPLERCLVVTGPRLVEQRADDAEELGRVRMRFGLRPADDRLARLVRQLALELATHLLRRDDDHVQPPAVANGPVDLLADRLQVPLDDVVDVPLVAGLRPAALVVLPGHLLRLVGELLETSLAQLVDHPSLARDDGDERAVPAAELTGERRDPQFRPDRPAVGGLEQRHDAEVVVGRRREDGECPRPVAVELVLAPVLDPPEVRLEREPAVAAAPGGTLLRLLLGLEDTGAELRLLLGNRRNGRGIEVDIDADGTAVCRAESCELAEKPLGHDRGHDAFLTAAPGTIPRERPAALWRLLQQNTIFERSTLSDQNDLRELIIIGGGPAGYTAALYAARADLEPLVIEGFQWGGQLMITSDVENYPGYADGVMGPEMMSDFRRQAQRFGSEFITDDVTKVDFSEQPLRVWVGDDLYTARAVIVATGASARWLGIDSEQQHRGRGVSTCATCDGAFFREKDVYVVGGGDSAFEEALFLTKFASRVHLVHRRDEFRASKIMVDRAKKNEKLDFVLNAVVEEIVGDVKVEALRLRNTVTDETWVVPADGVFVAIGHDPNTSLFVDQLDHDAAGYLITKPGTTETNVPGIFAAGDVKDHTYRQAITAAGSGCMSALDAERYLAAVEGHPGTAL